MMTAMMRNDNWVLVMKKKKDRRALCFSSGLTSLLREKERERAWNFFIWIPRYDLQPTTTVVTRKKRDPTLCECVCFVSCGDDIAERWWLKRPIVTLRMEVDVGGSFFFFGFESFVPSEDRLSWTRNYEWNSESSLVICHSLVVRKW